MDTLSVSLACCLLLISFTVAQTEKGNLTFTPPEPTPGMNVTQRTTFAMPSASTVRAADVSNVTEDTTPFTGVTWDSDTLNETTSRPETSKSATILTPLTNSSSPTTTAPDAQTSTALTVSAGHTSTPDTTVLTTANSSQTVNTTPDSVDRITQGFGLKTSEKNMTIVFSVALGVSAVALVIVMFHSCKQKIQYLPQPLNNTNDTDAFEVDDDTLIISGGLYDGHPIHDNASTAPEDQSQFCLEFLH